jgi:hypothetical protein
MRTLRVANARQLARVLKAILKQYGTHEAAAEGLGISQPHFTRLVNGGAGRRINRSLVLSAERVLYSQVLPSNRDRYQKLWRDLWGSVIGWEATDLLRKHDDWLQGKLRPYYTGNFYRHDFVLRQLREDSGYCGYFSGFDKAAAAHKPLRIELALQRVAEPLVAGEETNGVERTWEEMDEAKDLGPYLRAALRREELLLRRAPDMQRAQKLISSRTAAPMPRKTKHSKKRS